MTKVNGTLENLESQFCKLANTPPTNLKSIQYLSRKELKELGNVIQKMYLINSKFRRGRIWYPSN